LNSTEYLNAENLKLILVGATGTILAGAIIAIARRMFLQKAKLVWTTNHQWVRYVDNEKGKLGCDLHRFLIENCSSITAKEVEVFVSSSIQNLEVRRLKRSWRSVRPATVASRDESISFVTDQENKTKIKIPNLEGRSVIVGSYTTETWAGSEPSMVHFDNQIAEPVLHEFWFLRKRDAFVRTFLDNSIGVPLLFAFTCMFIYLLVKS
jgi:hypothetical protein